MLVRSRIAPRFPCELGASSSRALRSKASNREVREESREGRKESQTALTYALRFTRRNGPFRVASTRE